MFFGLGWGWAGLCPGPAIVVWTAGYPKVVLAFVPAMALGAVFFAWLDQKYLSKWDPRLQFDSTTTKIAVTATPLASQASGV